MSKPRIAFTIAFVWFGVPLLAWGLDDVHGFFSHPARAGVFVTLAAILLGFLPFAVRRLASGAIGSPGIESKRVRRQEVVRRVLSLFVILLLALAVRGDRTGFATFSSAAEPLRYVGLALFVASFGLAMWANLALGKQLSHEVTIQEGHELVTRGAYRLVRHPKYLAGMLVLVAISLVFRSWPALVSLVLAFPVFLFRIRDEERLLAGEFGDRWRDYASRTSRLVPHVF